MSQASDGYHTPLQPAVQKRDETFVVRIVSLDYYMAKPLPGLDMCFSPLEGTVIDRVPVIQIYGSTPGGQKTCVHLHKVRQCTRLYTCNFPESWAGPGDLTWHAASLQAFPYFYVPYEDDFPTDPAQGVILQTPLLQRATQIQYLLHMQPLQHLEGASMLDAYP